MKFEEYYDPSGKEFRGWIIQHNGRYLSTDMTWTVAKSHALRITPEMIKQIEPEFNFDIPARIHWVDEQRMMVEKMAHKVNAVTAPHRHGQEISKSKLDKLSDFQIAFEKYFGIL